MDEQKPNVTEDLTQSAATKNQPLMCADKESQLVIIDIQTKLSDVMPRKVSSRVVENTGLLLQAAAILDVPVLATLQYPQGLGPLSAELHEHLPASAQQFEKTCFACTGEDAFVTELKTNQRPQVILTGMEAHVCVLQTAFEIAQRGMQVFVVGDAICSRRLDNYQNALERMHNAGIIVTSTESVLFEWLRDAGHEHFKAISALLR